MKFGTRLFGVMPEAVVAKAQKAEELGYDSVWRGDHLIVPAEMTSPYPYSGSSRPPFRADTPIVDVLMTLAFVAAATSRIKLATGVFVLPLRDPIPVARDVQTLDTLSGGRVVFGIGTGWLEEEFVAVGKPFAGRGKATDEAIAVLKTLWTDEEPRFHGSRFHVDNVRFEPKPVQKPHPPIVGGGESSAALARAARLCDGWYGHRPTPGEAAATIARLDALRREFGTENRPFEVTVRAHPAALSRDDVARFEEAGVARIVLELGSFDDVDGRDTDLPELEHFAEAFL